MSCRALHGGLRLSPRRGHKLQRHPIHAIAQARGLGAILEHMADMPAAAAAMDFGAGREQRVILLLAHGIGQHVEEARPAGAAFEFRLGRIKRQVAAGAIIAALAFLRIECAGEGALGVFLAEHGKLLWRLLAGGYGKSRFDDQEKPFTNTYATPGWQRAQERWAKGGSARSTPNFIAGEMVARETEAVSYEKGERVFHEKFGSGTIRAVDGNKLTIDFNKAGEKRVIDSFVSRA